MRPSSRRLVIGLLCALAVGTADSSARQGNTPSPPSQLSPFRTQTDLILVDVSVLDSQRRPVHGLTVGDFTLVEDGTVRPITTIAEMSAPDPEPDVPAGSWRRTVVSDVASNNADNGRVLLLILDDARTPELPVRAQNGRSESVSPKNAVKAVARAIVERLGPADFASVIFTVKNEGEQEFTRDRGRLLAAIDGFVPVPPDAGGFNASRAADTYAKAATWLGNIPGRRKAVILISPAAPVVLPLDVNAASVSAPHSPPSFVMTSTLPSPSFTAVEGRPKVDVPMPGMADLMTGTRIGDAKIAQQTLASSLRGNVTFYNINPLRMMDLDPELAPLLRVGSIVTDRPVASFGPPTSAPPPTPERYDSASVPRYPLDWATGGFSISRREEFADGVTQIFRETGSYYLLGYADSDPSHAGRLRKIEVRVNRPDLTVRARTYAAPSANAKADATSPLAEAVSGLLPGTDIPLRLNVSTFAIPGRNETALAMAIGLREPRPAETATPETVRILTAVFLPGKGLQGKPQLTTARLQLPPNRLEGSQQFSYEVLSRLVLKPGRYHLRLSATSEVQGKTGSIYYDLEVPDYAKPPLSLSGVVLSMTPGLLSAPGDVLSTILPVIPTTEREFDGQRVAAYLRIYEGGKLSLRPVRLSVQVLDVHDTVVVSSGDEIDVGRFDKARAAEWRYNLPIDRLDPGDYLLRIDATMAGAALVRQDVRFAVKEK